MGACQVLFSWQSFLALCRVGDVHTDSIAGSLQGLLRNLRNCEFYHKEFTWNGGLTFGETLRQPSSQESDDDWGRFCKCSRMGSKNYKVPNGVLILYLIKFAGFIGICCM